MGKYTVGMNALLKIIERSLNEGKPLREYLTFIKDEKVVSVNILSDYAITITTEGEF